jgi:hypothetical protein
MTALTTTSATLSASLPSVPRPPSRPLVARLSVRPRRRGQLRCDAVSELAPAASTAYGVLLLGGGVFACTQGRIHGPCCLGCSPGRGPLAVGVCFIKMA